MKLKCFYIVFCFSILFCVDSFALTLIERETTRIQKAYENIQDISGSFTQKSFIKDLNRIDTFKGQFFIKMPMKMKWMYTGESTQEIFINNDVIIIYQEKEKQAFRSRFDRKTYGQAPIALLSGFGNIKEEFNVSEKNGKLNLKPKNQTDGILYIEVETSEEGFPIRSFTIYDTHSNRTELTFLDVKMNTGLSEDLFKPSFPKGTNIYEYTQ